MEGVKLHTDVSSPFVADNLDGLYAQIDALAETMSIPELTEETLRKVEDLLSDPKLETEKHPSANTSIISNTQVATRWLAVRRVMGHAQKRRAEAA